MWHLPGKADISVILKLSKNKNKKIFLSEMSTIFFSDCSWCRDPDLSIDEV
jgi:hypothetical protein